MHLMEGKNHEKYIFIQINCKNWNKETKMNSVIVYTMKILSFQIKELRDIF